MSLFCLFAPLGCHRLSAGQVRVHAASVCKNVGDGRVDNRQSEGGIPIDEKPELEAGYRSLHRGSLVWMNVPWALMGLGIVTGRVSSVHEYLIPSAGNPNVKLWWFVIGALAAWGTFWMFTGGAQRLAQHPGLLFVPRGSPKRIKLIWLGGCLWNLFFAALLFSGFPADMERGNRLETILAAVFPFAFVAMWLGVGFALGHMSGWATLADSYPQTPPYRGALVSTSGRMGLTSYSGVIRLGADESALHLSVVFLFRVGHPPLSIPWSSIQVSIRKGFFIEYVRFRIDDVRLDVRKKDVLRLGRKQRLPPALSHLNG